MTLVSTQSPSTWTKPDFIHSPGDPRGGVTNYSPPFLFRNVTARSFALRANVAQLTEFCNLYLNMDIPPEIVHYTPALPLVYLTILNYGSMSVASVQAQNMGWMGQREVLFAVLLQRWRRENGVLVFKDWATVSPFIYVDDDFSVNTGREAYGWNKVAGSVDATVPLWIQDPRAKQRELSFSVTDFATLYRGERDAKQPLIEIDRDAEPSFTRFPPDPRDPWSPLWAVPNAIANVASLVASGLDIDLALRVRGYETNRTLASLGAMGKRALEQVRSVMPVILPDNGVARDNGNGLIADQPRLYFDNVTLKQFRNAEDPSLACYQALVSSKMGVDRFNAGGLLGDVNLLRGDTSGGYSIRIHEMASQPIVQTLGLEVADRYDESDGGSVAVLKPVLPTWLDVDLYYGGGELICSRAPQAQRGHEPSMDWRDEMDSAVNGKVEKPTPPLYNTTLGGATQPIVGPFHFPDVTVQVYPLLADRDILDNILKDYLNDPLAKGGMTGFDGVDREAWSFKTFGSYVYMMVTVYGDKFGSMWSGVNNIGQFFDREVTFCIPVKWYDEAGSLMTVGVIEPFTFSNNARAVATDREVNGYNSIQATIESPADVWLDRNGPDAKRRFLHMATEVIPALNVGAEAEQRTILEIDERDVVSESDELVWRRIADTWGRDLIDEVKRKSYLASSQSSEVTDAKALALELLANGAPLNRIILKQYLDGEDLKKACYQALVRATTTIKAIYDIREIPSDVSVRFFQQPGLMIADALGLKIKYRESRGGDVIDVVQPMRPFWMRLGIEEDLATVLCYRSSNDPWQVVHPGINASPWERVAVPPSSSPIDVAIANAMAVVPSYWSPYFARSGDAAVGDSLGTQIGNKSDDRLGVKHQAAQWLRDALTNEIVWIKACYQSQFGWSDADKKKFSDFILGELAAPHAPGWDASKEISAVFAAHANFDALLKAPCVREFCDGMSASQLSQFAGVLKGVLEGADVAPLEPGNIAPDAWLSVSSKDLASFGDIVEQLGKVAAWIDELRQKAESSVTPQALVWFGDALDAAPWWGGGLEIFLGSLKILTPLSRDAYALTLTQAARDLLAELSDFEMPSFNLSGSPDSSGAVQDNPDLDVDAVARVSLKLSQAKNLLTLIRPAADDWCNPSRWRRISYQNAATSMAALDDVQVVIDNILSHQWENRGNVGVWSDEYDAPLPPAFVPDGPDVQMLATETGLQRWTTAPTPEQADGVWLVS